MRQLLHYPTISSPPAFFPLVSVPVPVPVPVPVSVPVSVSASDVRKPSHRKATDTSYSHVSLQSAPVHSVPPSTTRKVPCAIYAAPLRALPLVSQVNSAAFSHLPKCQNANRLAFRSTFTNEYPPSIAVSACNAIVSNPECMRRNVKRTRTSPHA